MLVGYCEILVSYFILIVGKIYIYVYIQRDNRVYIFIIHILGGFVTIVCLESSHILDGFPTIFVQNPYRLRIFVI
ncbi:hypothetical protein KFK09_014866 [Dendrobium nobile]|uniref:Uncharacterized protein n=1 Tax=Dendrobium nobile TaxID=94219 RepID=A0A8T3B396_DENNO|nr:hypothetical protein KFK09_014866 [Dendrobium nobile]